MFLVCTLAALTAGVLSVPVAWQWIGSWAIFTAPLFASAGYLIASLLLQPRKPVSTGNPRSGDDRSANSVLGS